LRKIIDNIIVKPEHLGKWLKMYNKKFDCVKLKNELQEILYNELQSVSSEDYLKKLIKKFNQSAFLKKLKSKKRKTVLV